MYAFGKMMRKLIAEHGTTQADISRATGINKQNISLMCNGKTQYPSIHASKASVANSCEQPHYLRFCESPPRIRRSKSATWDAAGTRELVSRQI